MNITEMINRHKGDYAYNIIDVEPSGRHQPDVQAEADRGSGVMARVVESP